MRLGPTCFVLLCSFIWECIGAPPEKRSNCAFSTAYKVFETNLSIGVVDHIPRWIEAVSLPYIAVLTVSNALPAGQKNVGSVKYTIPEDQFIVDELSKIVDDTVPFHSQTLWDTLAEKYQEQYKQGKPGFLPGRSAQSLLNRFKNVLIHNHLRNEVKVPQDLMQKIVTRSYIQKPERAGWSPWTKEENDFIIEELLKPTYTKLHSSSTFEAIRAEHDRRREAGITGFQNVRHNDSIRSHLGRMKRHGQIPNEVLENLDTRQKGIRYLYNKYENDFIIKELSKPSYTTLFSPSTYEAIRAKHAKKRKAGINGFKNMRTFDSIRGHLFFMKENGLLPNELREKFKTHHKGASSSSSTNQNQESALQVTNEGEVGDDWIADMIEELQNNTDFEIDFSKLDSMADD